MHELGDDAALCRAYAIQAAWCNKFGTLRRMGSDSVDWGRTAVKSDDECSRSKNSAPMQPCDRSAHHPKSAKTDATGHKHSNFPGNDTSLVSLRSLQPEQAGGLPAEEYADIPISNSITRHARSEGGARVHIHDQVGGLGERVGLHAQRVVQVLGGREKLARVPLQQLHALVPVVLPQSKDAQGLCNLDWGLKNR